MDKLLLSRFSKSCNHRKNFVSKHGGLGIKLANCFAAGLPGLHKMVSPTPVQRRDCILNIFNKEQRLLLDHVINSISIKPFVQHCPCCRDTCKLPQHQTRPASMSCITHTVKVYAITRTPRQLRRLLCSTDGDHRDHSGFRWPE